MCVRDSPFVVVGRYSEVEVTGTAFSVRRDDDNDRTILARGNLQVSRLSDMTDQAHLGSGQMIFATETALSPVMSSDAGQQIAWLNGRVIFADRPFHQALAELQRYYSRSVILTTSRLDSVLVNGNYRIDEPRIAIRTLAEAAGAHVTQLPGGILILH